MVNLTHANNGNRLDAIPLIVTRHASIILLLEIRVTGEAERAGRWARLDSGGSHVGPSAVKREVRSDLFGSKSARTGVYKEQDSAAYIPAHKDYLICLLALKREEREKRDIWIQGTIRGRARWVLYALVRFPKGGCLLYLTLFIIMGTREARLGKPGTIMI